MAGYQSKLKTFSQRPYYDDFDISNKFLQILYRPGMAVQARELTQMQTILQEQIARLSSHFFDNGSKIIGGETSVKQKVEYIKLPDTIGLPTSDTHEYVGGTITKGTLSANIIHFVERTSTDHDTVYVEYTSSDGHIQSLSSTSIYRINVTNGGSGYTGTPTVTIVGTGSGAIATANITTGAITSIDVVNVGSGYDDTTTVLISGTGTGATATVELINTEVTFNLLNKTTNVVEGFVVDIASTNVGYGALVFINDGIYYVNGRFAIIDKQSLVVSKYTDITATQNQISVGFLVDDLIITPEDDSGLYDNAIGSPNESAPGATRYVMNLTLAVKPTDDTIKNFIQLMILESGQASTPQNTTDYTNLFLDIFARRTYDESGDYIVNDFMIDIQEHLNTGSNRGKYLAGDGGDESKIHLTLDPGKAYVRGYEVPKDTPTFLSTDKSRDVESIRNMYISNPYETYVNIDLNPLLTTPSGPTTKMPFDILSSSSPIEFKSSAGVTLYQANPLGMKWVYGTTYKLYFTKFKQIVSTANIKNITHIFQSSKCAQVEIISLVPTVIVNQNNSKFLLPIPLSYVKTINEATLTTYKAYTGTVSSNTITLADSSTQFKSGSDSYVVHVGTSSGSALGFFTPTTINVSSGSLVEIEVPNGYNGENFYVLASVGKSTYTAKSKTVTPVIDETYTLYSTTALSTVKLSKTDVIAITAIDIDGEDYTSRYNLDTGQRDDLYDYGIISVKPGVSVPSQGVIKISYTYFFHSSVGDFFTVASYASMPGGYAAIPSYKNTFLGNVIDLRTSVTNPPMSVVPSTDIIIDYDYYLSRVDNVVLNNKGQFSVVRGVPALNPQVPVEVDNSITLYTLNVPAYTFKLSDISVDKKNYKRYTMRDISNLEKRIENIEYYTQLSLLESDIQGKEFFDKFKSGFIVDNFESLTTGDVENQLHTMAIDFNQGEIRPESITHSVNLVNKSITNGVLNDGILTLPYTETSHVEQMLASTVVRLQPFIKYNWNGKVTLSPNVDRWVSFQYAPDLNLDAGTFPSEQRADVLQNKIWDVAARVFVGNEVGNSESGSVSIPVEGNVQATAGVQRIGRFGSWRNRRNLFQSTTVTSQTNFVGTRVVDVGVVPWIRSRWVEFTITGLKPNTVVKPYFDGRDVSAYCYNSYPSWNYWYYWHYWNGQSNTTPTMATSTNQVLKSNGAGVIVGWFLIPNNEAIRFKTGVRKFEVKDVIENPSTSAEGTYDASGTSITLQNVFVTTRFVSTQNFWSDPLAQSFMLTNPEGAFISSIDLYFGPDAVTAPNWVTVQVRDMVNGYPGTSVVATKDVYVTQGSFDATVSTNFKFDYPFYLEPNKEYAFVVLSNAEDLTLWCAELGQKSVRPGDVNNFTGEYINKQPYLGSMFKSQNNKTWTTEQSQDIKFKINRAKFDNSVTGSVLFANMLETNDVDSEGNIFKTILDDNPLSVKYGITLDVTAGGTGYTAATVSFTGGGGTGLAANVIVEDGKVTGFDITSPGSGYITNNIVPTIVGDGNGADGKATLHFGKTIKVSHKNHGFKTNDICNLSFAGVGANVLGDFAVADLSGPHVITTEDIDSYTFEVTTLTTNDKTVNNGGGSKITATQAIPYSYVRLNSDSIVLNGTDLIWTLQTRGYYSTNPIDSTQYGIIEDKVIDLGELKVIGKNNDGSMQLKGTFSSDNEFISPVIDVNKLSMYVVCNRINELNDSVVLSNGDTSYEVNNSIARYATKNITLINPSNEIQVYLDTNLPTGTQVDVYCKVSMSETSATLDDYEWKPMSVIAGGEYTDSNVFKETKYQYESPTDFTNFVIKVVYSTTIVKGDNRYRALVPRSKRFRAIALKN